MQLDSDNQIHLVNWKFLLNVIYGDLHFSTDLDSDMTFYGFNHHFCDECVYLFPSPKNANIFTTFECFGLKRFLYRMQSA